MSKNTDNKILMTQVFKDLKKMIAGNDFLKIIFLAGFVCLVILAVYYLGKEFGAIIAQFQK